MFECAANSILPIKALYEYAIAKYTYEVTHGLTHSNIRFELARGQNARRHYRLHVPRTEKTAGDKRISVAGPRIYNSLPERARTTYSLSVHIAESRRFAKTNLEKYLS